MADGNTVGFAPRLLRDGEGRGSDSVILRSDGDVGVRDVGVRDMGVRDVGLRVGITRIRRFMEAIE